jgi:hypothetical protein
MNKFNPLLLIGILLIGGSIIVSRIPSPSLVPESSQIAQPTNTELLELCKPVTVALNGSGEDGQKLANLYNDLATLIEIDDGIIKNTEEIREANRVGGKMSKLDLKDKYPNLAEAANALVVAYIGDDNVVLSTELRQKSVEAFRALAWACQEGAK